MSKSQYVTVAPVTPKGKWMVCARRVGSKERLTPICECRTELAADKITDGLNLLQGETVKLDAPAERELSIVKTSLNNKLAENRKLYGDVSTHEAKIRDLTRQVDRLTAERNAAQQKARETA